MEGLLRVPGLPWRAIGEVEVLWHGRHEGTVIFATPCVCVCVCVWHANNQFRFRVFTSIFHVKEVGKYRVGYAAVFKAT